MGSGSQGSSSNATVSYDIFNRKTRLIDTGTNVQAATKVGHGQEALSEDNSAGMYKYYNYELVGTSHWQSKIGALLYAQKFGTFYPLTTTIGDNVGGLWRGVSTTGTLAIAALDTTDGLTATFTTAASGGSQGGLNRALLYTTRQWNPYFMLRFKLDEAGANIRFFAGFTSATAVIGNNDDPLNALSGFGIGILTTQANYRILSNDGVGATVSADSGVAKDTNYHTFELWADENGTRFLWSIDNSTPSAVSSEIPASTTSLSCQFLTTAVNADAKVMNVHKSVITTDK